MTKRIYRKKLPNPDGSASTEFNRTSKKLNIRTDPKLIEALKESATDMGITQTQWLKEAIEAKLLAEAPKTKNNLDYEQ